MVLIRQNKGAKIILHAKSPTFRAAKLKGLTVTLQLNAKLQRSTELYRVRYIQSQ